MPFMKKYAKKQKICLINVEFTSILYSVDILGRLDFYTICCKYDDIS